MITAGVQSPTLGVGIGYARFYSAGNWVGLTLELRLQDGNIHSCEIVGLPFFDKEKAIVKGKDCTIPQRNSVKPPF